MGDEPIDQRESEETQGAEETVIKTMRANRNQTTIVHVKLPDGGFLDVTLDPMRRNRRAGWQLRLPPGSEIEHVPKKSEEK